MVVSLLLIAAAVSLWHVRDELRDRTDSRNLEQAWIGMHLPSDWTIIVPSQLGFDTRPLEAKGSHVMGVDLRSADDVRRLMGLQGPAVVSR